MKFLSLGAMEGWSKQKIKKTLSSLPGTCPICLDDEELLMSYTSACKVRPHYWCFVRNKTTQGTKQIMWSAGWRVTDTPLSLLCMMGPWAGYHYSRTWSVSDRQKIYLRAKRLMPSLPKAFPFRWPNWVDIPMQ